MTTPFLVLAQPRSRTAWLSSFLTYGPWYCGHEEARHLRSIEDAASWLNTPFTGSAETAVAPYWRTLVKLRPDVKIVTVRRPVQESIDSFNKLPFQWDQTFLRNRVEQIDRKLDQIKARLAGVMEVNFHDLTDETVCARLFEHCLELPHNSARWQQMSTMNIQCNMGHISRYVGANFKAMQKTAWLAKQDALLDFDRHQVFREPPELTFKEETDHLAFVEKARADGVLEKHASLTGWEPNAIDDFDLDRIGADMAAGNFQIISASSNGVLRGYLLTAIGNSIAHKGERIAEHASFYASDLFPGLGRQLLKAAREALRHHGVDKLKLKAGINGDGPRLRKIYERAGASYQGEAFIQDL